MSHHHIPILRDKIVSVLCQDPDGFYIDATFGRGGHASAILQTLSPKGRLLVTDRDPDAIAQAKKNFSNDTRLICQQANFSDCARLVEDLNWTGKVTGILADCGVSSPQLDVADRGFSFLRDGPLDMRMNPTHGQSASDWLARCSAEECAGVLKDYGEERYAKRIANAIITARQQQPITRTLALANIIRDAHPRWPKDQHPATRSFQAIRIFVNDELNQITRLLEQALTILKPGGRLAIISFHSLEDRLVKQFIQKHSQPDTAPAGLPLRADQLPVGQLQRAARLIRPSDDEIAQNPRARSARLRIMETCT